jgi:predicted DCC family thiol-disulfide oxidoreductase YuxK
MGAVERSADWLLVFDGDCGFCRYSVDYARAVTDVAAPAQVRYEPYQTAAVRYPDVPLTDFECSIQLFTATDRFRGAEAAFMVLALAPRLCGWLWCYRTLPGASALFETLYRLTARHRGVAFWLARAAFGGRLRPLAVARTARWVTAGIGLSALCAFASWWVQANGLIGPNGILPVAGFMDAVRGQLGSGALLQLPTLYWLSSAPWMTTCLCAVGALASLGMLFAVYPVICALVGYVCYLSLAYGGQVFMNYQWDILLVESLLVAAVLGAQPRVGIWLTRLLVFRFMLLSGAVKLLSGDPTWRDLAALDYHFETQPLPTPLAWYAHQLPHDVLHAGVVATFAIELLLPFCIFLPRNPRLLAAFGFILLELLIAATGNYNFFNLLTIVLCLSLLDDRVFGAGWRTWRPRRVATPWYAVTVVALLLGVVQIQATTTRSPLAGWELALLEVAAPWRAVNSYGLFAVMTTERDELVVQSSDDGERWQPLRFRFKPQALDAAPHWVAPHQPRLDWQMWFAALTSREGAPWFDYFVVRLLDGSPAVWSLLATPPPETPPRYVRVLRYRYHFTTPAERAASGDWWAREFVGVWYPAARLAHPVVEPGLREIPEAGG